MLVTSLVYDSRCKRHLLNVDAWLQRKKKVLIAKTVNNILYLSPTPTVTDINVTQYYPKCLKEDEQAINKVVKKVVSSITKICLGRMMRRCLIQIRLILAVSNPKMFQRACDMQHVSSDQVQRRFCWWSLELGLQMVKIGPSRFFEVVWIKH